MVLATAMAVGPTIDVESDVDIPVVLGWVNDIRALLGRAPISRLPAGKRADTWDCSIARALGGTCRATPIWITLDDRKRTRVPTPGPIAHFIEDFDGALLPREYYE